MALAAVTSQNVASGKELQVQSLAVTGGTLYLSTIRDGGMDLGGVAQTFVPTFTAGTSSGARSIATLTTVGAGTITAAQIGAGIVQRSGPIAAFTDTTATAALILAALPTFVQNSSIAIDYINTTNFTATIAGGTNVTPSGLLVVGANSLARFLLTRTDANTGTPTFTLVGYAVQDLANQPELVATALTTVGAGTLTAAAIVGGAIVRTGSTSNFTDTTDTAAAIITALPAGNVGQSWIAVYANNTAATATITNGASVTCSGPLVVPPGSSAVALVTMNGLTTVTWQTLYVTPPGALPSTKYSTIAVTTGTLAAGNASGADKVFLLSTGATPGSQAMRTPAQVLTDSPGLAIGQSYFLRVLNTGAGTFTLATDSGAGFTMTGTMTVAQNTSRDFTVTMNSATTGTVQQVGTGTTS